MQYYAVLLLSLALAVDALIVSFTYGLVIKEHRVKNALSLGMATGIGQFVMPLIGYGLTGSVHSFVEHWDHWIAFSVFLILGLRVISQAVGKKEEDGEHVASRLSFKVLLGTGIATSIDALVAGASLYFSKNDADFSMHIVPASTTIGVVTFLCAFLGFMAARHLHKLPSKALEIAAGFVLIGLGVKVLVEHLS